MTEAASQLEVDIHQGFAAFVEAAKRLEESYESLQARAHAIDLQLAQTNHELEDSLAEREAILQALPMGVIRRDGDGQVTWRNPEGERLSAAAASQGLVLDTDDEEQVNHQDLCLRLKRVAMAGGGSLLLVDDRSRVVGLEREVHRLDRLAGLSELALGIAHEIKNPLNGVMGFAALMARTKDPAKVQKFASNIAAGLEQVDSIVKELLAFARPAGVAVRSAALEQIVNEAATAAGVPRSWIRIVAGGEQLAECTSLVRVLANLFRNSAEAVASGSVQIQVSAVQEGEDLRIVVADDGPGVDAELAERVFQPFVSSKDRGHGLGLALACRVLSFLNGSIELRNAGQPGATFEVRVPIGGEAG